MEKTILALGVLLLVGATFYLNNSNNVEDKTFELFQSWKLKYNKKYNNHNMEMYRFKVFLENYALVKENQLNQHKYTYTLELNQFADLPSEEFAQTYLNLQVPKNHVAVKSTETKRMVGSDYRVQCSSVRNQGSCGSCWAFSAVGVIECNASIEFGKKLDLSEQELVDCSGTYGNQGCNGGWMDDAFQYIIDRGVASEAAYGYTGKDGKCKEVADKYNIVTGFVDISEGDCDGLASAAQKRAVSVAVDASTWSLYSSGVITDAKCKKNLNHGVVVVGVTDGNWLVRNSWGISWGQQGHIVLEGGKDTCGVCQVASYPTLKF